MKVEYINANELKTYVNNAKIHTEEQIAQIKKSIQEFGMNDPIGVWKDNEIIEGHGRYIALTELGWEKIPIIRLEHLDENQKKAYALVHNKLTMNTPFDRDVLQNELENIDFRLEEFGLFKHEHSDFFDEEYREAPKTTIFVYTESEQQCKALEEEIKSIGVKCKRV